jgi:hypothetical protein
MGMSVVVSLDRGLTNAKAMSMSLSDRWSLLLTFRAGLAMYIVRDTSPVPFRTNTRSLGKSSDSLKNSLYRGQSPIS